MVPTWLPVFTAGAAALIALLFGLFALPVGRRLKLLDFPDREGRKRHASATPLIGGIAILCAFTIAVAATLSWADVGAPASRHLAWMLAVTLLIGWIGMFDDRLQLSASLRLAIAITALAIMVLSAPEFGLDFIRFTGQQRIMLLGWGGGLFTLLCLVGLLNAVNMADGKNGLVISLSAFWTLLLLFRAPAYLHPVLVSVFSALIVLFVFNMKGRLFLGDCGSYALSALLGLSAIYVYNHDFAQWRADGVALLFAIPVFDTIRLMAVRTLNRRSPFAPDRNHLHHHLSYGWGWPAGLVPYAALVAVPNLLALAWPEATPWLLAGSLLAYALVLRLADRRPPIDAHARDFH